MSDGNISQRVEAAAENGYVKLVARLALPAIAFVGMSAWGDLKDQGSKISLVLQNQARQDQVQVDLLRRVDNLEDWQKEIIYKGNRP